MDREGRVILMQRGREGAGYAIACYDTLEKSSSPSEPGLLSNTLWYKKSTDDGTSY